MSITITIAQLRTIVERADIEEAPNTFTVEIDLPDRGDPGDWEDPVRVVRDYSATGTELQRRILRREAGVFMFAVDENGTKLEGIG